MGGKGQTKYLNRIEVYNRIRSGELRGILDMGTKAIPGLKKLLETGEYWEKVKAIEALGMIGGEKAERLLKSVLRGGEWRIKKTAINLLADKELGWLDKELERTAKDPDFNIRYSALGALKRRKKRSLPPGRKRFPENFGNRKQAEKRVAGQYEKTT